MGMTFRGLGSDDWSKNWIVVLRHNMSIFSWEYSVKKKKIVQNNIISYLKIDLVYLCEEDSREQVILDTRLVYGVLELPAYLNRIRPVMSDH